MKIFKNKFFIIALAVAIFLTVLSSTLAIMGKTDPLKNAVNIIATPFRYAATQIKRSIEGFSRYFESVDRLSEENESLRDRVDELESLLVNAEQAEQENARLREYLEVKSTYPDFELIDALIVGTESENYMTLFTLNKGKGDGIKLGMPVMVKEGLVGSVCELGYNWCRVRALTEASASVGAYVSRSGETGILSGDISLKDTGECILTYLPENADVEVGDLVYTSGIGSVYPRALFIGKVISVENNEYLRTKTAKVECAVDFDSLRYVMVIIDYEIYTEGASE